MLQHVGCGLERALLVTQTLDLGGDGWPVELGEIAVLLHAAQRLHSIARRLLLRVQCRDASTGVAQPRLERERLGQQSLDLGLVAPAEHVATALVDAMSIVFLVAFTRRLDQPGARDRARLAPELLDAAAARDVEAMRELPFEPGVERRIGLDGELVHERVGMQRGQVGAGVLAPDPHAEVHEPAPQVRSVDPVADKGVVRIGHEQRQAERAQQSLRRTFPIALAIANLDQLAGERHVCFAQTERLAQTGPQGDLLGVDIAAARLQAADLVGKRFMFLPPLREADLDLGQLVLHLGLALGGGLAQLRADLALFDEVLRAVHREKTEFASQFVVAPALVRASLLLGLVALDVERQALETVAAAVGNGAAQLPLLRRLCRALRLQAREVALVAPEFIVQMAEPLRQQFPLQPGEKRVQGFAASAQCFGLRCEFIVARAIGHQRRQQLDLPLGLEHRLVRAVQVLEMSNQRRDARRDVERLEHVVAHEVRQVADRLHRHGLMEQLHRLLVPDSQQAPELRAIGREAVVQIDAGAAQPLAQARDVGPETREVAGDGQLAIGHRVQPRRLAMRLLEPEDLGQRHRLVVARVVEHAEDHRVAAGIAQGDRAAGAAELAALGLVVPEHVGAQRPLAGVRAGRPVVGDPVGRDEQGRDRIHQRGFARADVAGEQRVARVGTQRPHARVESAPIQHFKSAQTEPRQLLFGEGFAAGRLTIHRGPLPVARDRPPGARRTAPAIARRRRP